MAVTGTGKITGTCLICGQRCAIEPGPNAMPVHTCSRCGQFSFVGVALNILNITIERGKLNRSLLSHHIRKATNAKKLFLITEEIIPRYLHNAKLPDPHEQAANLILWIGDNQPSFEVGAETAISPLAAAIGTAIKAADISEPGFQWLMRQLKDSGLYETPPGYGAFVNFRLTMSGWDKYNDLKRARVDSRIAFIAMPFGDADLTRVVDDCFKPAVARTGFELRMLTDRQPAGSIDDQLRTALRTSRFAIAELTHGNNGAYWEAGFAEGLGRPVIYTCRKREWDERKTHFDTNHLVTVIWEPERLADAGKRLTATIRATLPSEARLSDGE